MYRLILFPLFLVSACSLTSSLDDLDASTGASPAPGAGGVDSQGGAGAGGAGHAGAGQAQGGAGQAGSSGQGGAGNQGTGGLSGSGGSAGGAAGAGAGGAAGKAGSSTGGTSGSAGQGGTSGVGGAGQAGAGQTGAGAGGAGAGGAGQAGAGAGGENAGGAGQAGTGAGGAGAADAGAAGSGGAGEAGTGGVGEAGVSGTGGAGAAGDSGAGGAGQAGSGPVQPSCVSPLVCGSPADDCCRRARVDAGSFNAAHGTDGAVTASVDAFDLDVFEVTVGRFQAFVNAYSASSTPAAGAGARPDLPGSGWFSEWNSELPATVTELKSRLMCTPISGISPTWGTDPSRPINCVTWYAAFAFCVWDGGRLPTDIEWEYAAAGGELNRDYPWGNNDPDATLAAWDCSAGCTLSAVGSFPAGKGRWGHLDLAGNAREWALDWNLPYAQPCDHCANVGVGGSTYKSSRGGGLGNSDKTELLNTFRRGSSPDYGPSMDGPYADLGFRCAYPIK